jgi:hypothetical protein
METIMSYTTDLEQGRFSAQELARAQELRRAKLTQEQRDQEDAAFRTKDEAAAEQRKKAASDRRAEEQRQMEADETSRREQAEATAKDAAWRGWTGTRAAFDAAWPTLYAQQQQQQAAEARQRQASIYREVF